MDLKLGTELLSKNVLSLINHNECIARGKETAQSDAIFHPLYCACSILRNLGIAVDEGKDRIAVVAVQVWEGNITTCRDLQEQATEKRP